MLIELETLMSSENTQRLCQDFPQLYGTDFPIGCGDGWAHLLYELSRSVIDHAKQADLQLVITGVEEKCGCMRFYAAGADEEADRLIELAEATSETVAEYPR
jgi:hypothetical protein